MVAEMAFDRKLSVGAPFFNAAFTPFMVALGIMLCRLVPCCRGNAASWEKPLIRCATPLCLAVALGPAGLGDANRAQCIWGRLVCS